MQEIVITKKEEIGLLIQVSRRRMKMKQSELAEKLGVTDKYISAYECGRQLLSMKHYFGLIKVFGKNFGHQVIELAEN